MPKAFVVPVMASQSARSYAGSFRPSDKVELSANATFLLLQEMFLWMSSSRMISES
jgi:hypothetical protein